MALFPGFTRTVRVSLGQCLSAVWASVSPSVKWGRATLELPEALLALSWQFCIIMSAYCIRHTQPDTEEKGHSDALLMSPTHRRTSCQVRQRWPWQGPCCPGVPGPPPGFIADAGGHGVSYGEPLSWDLHPGASIPESLRPQESVGLGRPWAPWLSEGGSWARTEGSGLRSPV
jgi:hypothetical protein